MKKPLPNSNNFWQDDMVLKTKIERQKVEYFLEKARRKNNKFSSRLQKFFLNLFSKNF